MDECIEHAEDIFPKRLKMLRLKHGMSQFALSNELEMSNAAVCLHEKGDKLPTVRSLIKYACYFNVSVEYLLGLTDNYGGR